MGTAYPLTRSRAAPRTSDLLPGNDVNLQALRFQAKHHPIETVTMPQDMPPAGGYQPVQYKVRFSPHFNQAPQNIRSQTSS
jgi:hypothetical protein